MKSIDEGFALLRHAKPRERSYRVISEIKYVYDTQKPDLGALNPDTQAGPKYPMYDATRWQRFVDSSDCYTQIVFAKPDDPSRKARSFANVECDPINPNSFHSRYELKGCSETDERFVGVRDIGVFKQAFGVKIMCKRKHPNIDASYVWVAEIWYHPESNHYSRKVRESVMRWTLRGERQKETIGTNIPASAQVWFVNYENQIEPAPEDEFDTSPPSLRVSYQTTGPVSMPGPTKAFTACMVSSNSDAVVNTMHVGDLVFVSDAKSQGSLNTIHGMFWPTFPMATSKGTGMTSGSSAYGPFWNRNQWGSVLSDSTPTIKVSRVRNTSYFQVNLTGPIKLMSKPGMAQSGFHTVSVTNFTQSFYCFGVKEDAYHIAYPDDNPYSFF